MNLHQHQYKQKFNRRNKDSVFCKSNNHRLSQCPNVTDIKSRIALLRKVRFVLFVFSPYTFLDFAEPSISVKKCNKRHVSICNELCS